LLVSTKACLQDRSSGLFPPSFSHLTPKPSCRHLLGAFRCRHTCTRMFIINHNSSSRTSQAKHHHSHPKRSLVASQLSSLRPRVRPAYAVRITRNFQVRGIRLDLSGSTSSTLREIDVPSKYKTNRQTVALLDRPAFSRLQGCKSSHGVMDCELLPGSTIRESSCHFSAQGPSVLHYIRRLGTPSLTDCFSAVSCRHPTTDEKHGF
jgi:hypothetical protein